MGIEVTRNLVTMRQQRTVLVVGLGNIGPEYEQTRHNLGFLAVDEFVEHEGLSSWSAKTQLKSMVCEALIDGSKVIVAKPTTLMNLSGQAVQKLQDYFELNTEDILVLHDDIDLQFGTIRTRIGGGNGGHNGLKSIDNAIGEQYTRIKIGISNEHREHVDAGDYVLQRIPKKDWDGLDDVFGHTNEQIRAFIAGHLPANTQEL